VIQPDSGSVERGHNVTVSYFGQHQAAELPQEATVLETMGQVPGGEMVQRVRDLLGAFLFHGDMVNSKVRFLSGGEKSRLALARMLLNPANLLVLDEPTNHLDIASKKVLKDALGSFAGSFIIVSHDRAFMHGIISRVWEMRGGRLTDHIGGIDDYLETAAARRAADEHAGGDTTAASSNRHDSGSPGTGRKRISARELRRQAAKEREFLNKRLGPLQEKVREAEAAVQALEEKKEELEGLLADPMVHSHGQRMKELNLEYRNVTQQIDEMYVLWEKAEEEFSAAQEALKLS
jgi:ATP-binding cassette subfamily F protein 3